MVSHGLSERVFEPELPRPFPCPRKLIHVALERCGGAEPPSSPEPLGSDRLRRNHGGVRGGGARFARACAAAAAGRSAGHLARFRPVALLRPAHDAAHVRRARGLVRIHVHLRHAGRQKPPLGNGADPAARHSPVGADPRLSLLHGNILPRPVSRKCAGRRIRGDLRHLHQSGLEHGLFVLPVAAHGAARSRRGRARLPLHRLAEVLAA